MVVPAIALYSTPPSTVCSPPYDLEFTGRSPPSAPKPAVGGLTCLFSSPPPSVKHDRGNELSATSSFRSSNVGNEEFASPWHDRGSEFTATSSFRSCYPSWGSYSSLKRDHSPASVFHGPTSCSSSSNLSSSSLPLRIGREKSSSSSHSLGASSRVWILPKFKDPYWKEKRTNPKDYYVGLRQEWKFRVEEQERLVNDLHNMGVRIPHRRSLEMPTTNKPEYEAAVSFKEENNRMLMRRSRYFMLQLAIEMAEANQRELTENERNNALNNEKYLSDYAMSDEDM